MDNICVSYGAQRGFSTSRCMKFNKHAIVDVVRQEDKDHTFDVFSIKTFEMRHLS